ncbi:hypothetical protein JD844_011011 [Phrynosoma platyrhinos]|uniref:Uncharacterized protein n=1 Tax=Phrynosoma platyrhinos TaxID=52577 RepID=A0ABQ7THV1_PHRPL|nr:hypothetical protein JD844_011011 [Phrynosoma platyrhinos]
MAQAEPEALSLLAEVETTCTLFIRWLTIGASVFTVEFFDLLLYEVSSQDEPLTSQNEELHRTVKNHMQNSESLYSECFYLFSDLLQSLFKEAYALQKQIMELIEMVSVNSCATEESVAVMVSVIHILLEICSAVSSIDRALHANTWKFIIRQSLKHKSLIKNSLKHSDILNSLCEDILFSFQSCLQLAEQMKWSGAEESTDYKLFQRMNKLCRFFANSLVHYTKEFTPFLTDSCSQLHQTYLHIYSKFPPSLHAPVISKAHQDEIARGFLVTLDSLLSLLVSFRPFLEVVLSKTPDLSPELHFPQCQLLLSVMDTLPSQPHDVKAIWNTGSQFPEEIPRKPLLAALFHSLQQCSGELSLPAFFPGTMGTGQDEGPITFYHYVCIHLCTFITTLSVSHFHLLTVGYQNNEFQHHETKFELKSFPFKINTGDQLIHILISDSLAHCTLSLLTAPTTTRGDDVSEAKSPPLVLATQAIAPTSAHVKPELLTLLAKTPVGSLEMSQVIDIESASEEDVWDRGDIWDCELPILTPAHEIFVDTERTWDRALKSLPHRDQSTLGTEADDAACEEARLYKHFQDLVYNERLGGRPCSPSPSPTGKQVTFTAPTKMDHGSSPTCDMAHIYESHYSFPGCGSKLIHRAQAIHGVAEVRLDKFQIKACPAENYQVNLLGVLLRRLLFLMDADHQASTAVISLDQLYCFGDLLTIIKQFIEFFCVLSDTVFSLQVKFADRFPPKDTENLLLWQHLSLQALMPLLRQQVAHEIFVVGFAQCQKWLSSERSLKELPQVNIAFSALLSVCQTAGERLEMEQRIAIVETLGQFLVVLQATEVSSLPHLQQAFCLMFRLLQLFIQMLEPQMLIQIFTLQTSLIQLNPPDHVLIAVLDFLSSVGKTFIQPDFQVQVLPELCCLFATLLACNNWMIQQHAIEVFTQFAEETSHEDILPQCLNSEEIKSKVVGFLSKTHHIEESAEAKAGRMKEENVLLSLHLMEATAETQRALVLEPSAKRTCYSPSEVQYRSAIETAERTLEVVKLLLQKGPPPIWLAKKLETLQMTISNLRNSMC